MLTYEEYSAKNDVIYPEYRGAKNGDNNCRTVYHHDKAEINYALNFRRMAFRQYHLIKRDNDPDARTRLLHTIEVATISSHIARQLKLDPELTEAIAFGHDIAQPPCGFPADKFLDEKLRKGGDGDEDEEGFNHGKLASQILEWQSFKKKEEDVDRFIELEEISHYRTIDDRSDGGPFVSTISKEALDGIAKHTPTDGKYSNMPFTLEGQVVRIADNIAYFTQEITDALRQDEENVLAILRMYSTEDRPLYDDIAGVRMTVPSLEKGSKYVENDPHVLRDVFGVKLGPRLMYFIRNFISYNLGLLKDDELEFITVKDQDSHDRQLPILKYDDKAGFLVDFLWNMVVPKINKLQWVRERVEKNENKITKTFDYLLRNPPSGDVFYKKREEEVEYYYRDLSANLKKRRTIAHYIATLTDMEVNEIYNSL